MMQRNLNANATSSSHDPDLVGLFASEEEVREMLEDGGGEDIEALGEWEPEIRDPSRWTEVQVI